MIKCWAAIEELIRRQARHRKGFCIADVTPAFVLSQACDEMNELTENQCIEELADVFGCLLHYAIKRKWSLGQIEEAMLDKFLIRFSAEAQHGQ